jgi:hypothetical protein
MKKFEVLKYCDKKSLEGYITHKILLEMYDDNEDIPEDILDIICCINIPQNNSMIIGSRLQDQIDIKTMHYLIIEQIKNKLIN